MGGENTLFYLKWCGCAWFVCAWLTWCVAGVRIEKARSIIMTYRSWIYWLGFPFPHIPSQRDYHNVSWYIPVIQSSIQSHQSLMPAIVCIKGNIMCSWRYLLSKICYLPVVGHQQTCMKLICEPAGVSYDLCWYALQVASETCLPLCHLRLWCVVLPGLRQRSLNHRHSSAHPLQSDNVNNYTNICF